MRAKRPAKRLNRVSIGAPAAPWGASIGRCYTGAVEALRRYPVGTWSPTRPRQAAELNDRHDTGPSRIWTGEEIRDWLDSLDAVIDHHGLTATGRLLQELTRRGRARRGAASVHRQHALRQHHPGRGGPRLSRRPRPRAAAEEPRPLERAGDGGAGEPRGGRHRRGTSRPTRRPRPSTRSGSTTSSGPPPRTQPADLVYYQDHAAPGVYARAYLEGSITPGQLENFRRELRGPGLSSYPHPWLMPRLLGVPHRVDGARADHGHLPGPVPAVPRGPGPPAAVPTPRCGCSWATARPTSPSPLGAITLAAREQLDNLIFVVNCNLQRLDGPVRGNGQIIQELEAAFRGAGWNAIKVIWGRDWDPLLAGDRDGLLVRRMSETVRRAVPAVRRRVGRLHQGALLGRHARPRGPPDGRRAQEAAARGARPRQGPRGVRGGGGPPEAAPPSSSPAPSRATGSARAARAATLPTSRRS